MLGFTLEALVDPKNPRDLRDPPPEGWDSNIDTADYRSALFGSKSRLFTACEQWEERELSRHGFKVEYLYSRMSALGAVYNRVITKIDEEQPVTL